MLSDRKESILGVLAFVSGLMLFIAIVGYADSPKKESEKPDEPVSETTVTVPPCEPSPTK